MRVMSIHPEVRPIKSTLPSLEEYNLCLLTPFQIPNNRYSCFKHFFGYLIFCNKCYRQHFNAFCDHLLQLGDY